MWEYIEFRRMITPAIIEFIFFFVVLIAIALGVFGVSRDWPIAGPIAGIVIIVIARVVLEAMIVMFRIHSSLVEIDEKLSDLIEVIEDSDFERS